MEHLIWPAVVLFVGLFAVWILRKPLGRLIDRVTHIDKTGIRAAAQNVATAKIEQKQLIPSRDLMEVNFNPIIKDQETVLKNYWRTFSLIRRMSERLCCCEPLHGRKFTHNSIVQACSFMGRSLSC
jgi:hypothetical protein